MQTLDLCSLLDKIDNPVLMVQRLVHRIPKSIDYWPIVSTITGVALGVFWAGTGVVGCAMTTAGTVACVPAYLLGKTLDILTGHPMGEFGGNLAFLSGTVALLGAVLTISSAGSFFRSTVSMVPVLGNVTLLVWDDLKEQERREPQGKN